MELRAIIPDNFIHINGVEVFVDEFPTGYENIKAIQSINGKTYILDKDENGSFEDIDLEPIVDAHAAKVAEIEAEQAAQEQARQNYLNSWDYIRDQRNAKLAASDWTQLSDSPLKGDQAWLDYRQALRNITETYQTPQDVKWPEAPNA